MISGRSVVLYLAKLGIKFAVVTAILALFSLYPFWIAMATGGFIYMASISVITIEQALVGVALLSLGQSVWLAKVKYEST
jgi:hypothetical protein